MCSEIHVCVCDRMLSHIILFLLHKGLEFSHQGKGTEQVTGVLNPLVQQNSIRNKREFKKTVILLVVFIVALFGNIFWHAELFLRPQS